MYISKVQIRNFKNFYKTEFKFTNGVNVILGENDSGKSNFFHGLRLVLDKKLNWKNKVITEKDFNRELVDWKGHIIIISIEFSEIDSAIEEQAVLKNVTGTSYDTGNITYFFLPKRSVRTELSKLATLEELKQALELLTIEDYESIVTFGSSTDFLDDDIYNDMTFDEYFGKINYSGNLNERIFGCTGTSINNIGTIKNNLIDLTYIDALRNTEYELRQKNNVLMTMLRQLEGKISQQEKDKVESIVNDLNNEIGNIDQVKTLENKISEKIIQSVGLTYSKDVVLSSEMSSEISDVFRNLKLKSNDDEPFDIESNGLGTTNIIYIALKLLEYSYLRELKGQNTKYFLLLFEEPEAHLHKHVQMSLFEKTGFNMYSSNVQVILSTHSDNISASSKISRVNILEKFGKSSEVYFPSNALTENKIMKIERYLDAKNSELLFSKGVILVEGDAEEILIPIIVKRAFGLSLDELGISLINIGNVAFENIAVLFSQDRIRRKCSILTDIDKPIDDTSEKQNKAYQLGISRKRKLDDFTKDNRFIEPFYNTYTFEIELVKGNELYFDKLIDLTYTKESKKTESKKLIRSLNVLDYGGTSLKIANYNSKGWNAVILSGIIDEGFLIPDYILESLLFVAQEKFFNKSILDSILDFGFETCNLYDETVREQGTRKQKINEVIKCGRGSIYKLIKRMKEIKKNERNNPES